MLRLTKIMGVIGIGIIVRYDHMGGVLAKHNTTQNCFFKPIVVEVMTTRYVVDLFREMSFFDIIL
jgi:hypothetical protein